MKYLIVNADDFGYSYGINKGIIEAHTKGIVTSTSVMVDAIASKEATGLSDYPELSVGLHLVLKDFDNRNHIEQELDRQVEKFAAITGKLPDHIDAHKQRPNAKPAVKAVLEIYSKEHTVPVRSLCQANFIEGFFGLNIDGSGILDPANVSLEALKRAIDQTIGGYNELMCHPGYSDDYLRNASSYNDIREQELKAVTDPGIKEYLQQSGIQLVNWDKSNA